MYPSFGAQQDYMPVSAVNEQASVTDMMGEGSVHNQAQKSSWKSDPTKSLIGLWVMALLSYWLLGYFFRRYTAG